MLAIACGHKLYMWEYTVAGATPVIVLKTRRSMRAVHFHPSGLPMVLTAEVQDASVTTLLPETLTEEKSFVGRHDASGGGGGGGGNTAAAAAAVETTGPPSSVFEPPPAHLSAAIPIPTTRASAAAAAFAAAAAASAAVGHPRQETVFDIISGIRSRELGNQSQSAAAAAAAVVPTTIYQSHPLPASMVPIGREVPFPALLPTIAAHHHHQQQQAHQQQQQQQAHATELPHQAGTMRPGGRLRAPTADDFITQLATAYNTSLWNLIGEEQPPRVRLRLWNFDCSKPAAEFDEGFGVRLEMQDAVLCSEMGVHFSPCGKYLAATMACRLGPRLHTTSSSSSSNTTRIPTPAAVAAVTERLSVAADQLYAAAQDHTISMDWTPSQQQHEHHHHHHHEQPMAAPVHHHHHHYQQRREPSTPPHRPPPAPTTAPRQPPTTNRVVFEVRVMSMDGSSFGEVVRARRVRAAHCLTSVQFSPTGEHILLAYGKKHSSLLRSLVVEEGTLMPLHTILEVVSLRDMRLLRVLPSVEDEINAACFHPAPGGGLAYGTKEGRLRLVRARRNQFEEDGGGSIGNGGGGGGGVVGDAAALGGDVHEMMMLEQGMVFLQQQWERDTEVREHMRRERQARERAIAQDMLDTETQTQE